MQIQALLTQYRKPLLWGGVAIGDFVLCYFLGVLVAPYVAPIVDLYSGLFGFILNPPTLNPFDYPRP